MTELSKKIAEMKPDNLVAGIQPSLRVGNGVIRKGTAEAELKRGTLLAKSSTDAKLVVLGSTAATGETLEPYAVLADDVKVGTVEDANAAIYIGGKFNLNSVTVNSGYTLSESDKDTFRKYNIEFAASFTY